METSCNPFSFLSATQTQTPPSPTVRRILPSPDPPGPFVPLVSQVTIACDAVLNSASAYKKQEADSWEEEIQVSKHARSLQQLDNGARIPPR